MDKNLIYVSIGSIVVGFNTFMGLHRTLGKVNALNVAIAAFLMTLMAGLR